MTNSEDMSDAGVEGMPQFVVAPTHEQNVVAIREAVERLEVAVATIDARSAQTGRKVDDLTSNLHGLSRMIVVPSGMGLGNLVQQIFNKVQKLD